VSPRDKSTGVGFTVGVAAGGGMGVAVKSGVAVGDVNVALAVGVGDCRVIVGGTGVAVIEESCWQLLDARARKATRNDETSFFMTTSKSSPSPFALP